MQAFFLKLHKKEITTCNSVFGAGNGNRIPANVMNKNICSKAWEISIKPQKNIGAGNGNRTHL